MSSAPSWLNAILRQFGEAIGLKDFVLNDRGAAVLRFETGVALRFEYAFESLVVALQVPTPPEPAALRRFLSFAQPERRPGFKLRVAYLANQECVMLAARLAEREVTLPVLNTIFGELWQLSKG
jgi:type III secretion system chaperone SycN